MLQEISGDGEAPAPALVAAWFVLGVLLAERVPMWAAYWLVQGYDGESLVELAGLSGQPTYEVRDLLPAALEDAGVPALPTTQSALKTIYDHIATLHLDGHLDWGWTVNQVVELVIVHNYATEILDPPLGALWYIDDDLDAPWGRSAAELAQIVHQACLDQLQTAY